VQDGPTAWLGAQHEDVLGGGLAPGRERLRLVVVLRNEDDHPLLQQRFHGIPRSISDY
jgi:hypothetical protein